MKAYELLFFVDPAIEEGKKTSLMERIQSTITDQGGKVDNVDAWGKRALAYEINDLSEGDYTLIDFNLDPSNVAELDRVLHITDAVVRYLITAKVE